MARFAVNLFAVVGVLVQLGVGKSSNIVAGASVSLDAKSLQHVRQQLLQPGCGRVRRLESKEGGRRGLCRRGAETHFGSGLPSRKDGEIHGLLAKVANDVMVCVDGSADCWQAMGAASGAAFCVCVCGTGGPSALSLSRTGHTADEKAVLEHAYRVGRNAEVQFNHAPDVGKVLVGAKLTRGQKEG